jgi:TonB family protein
VKALRSSLDSKRRAVARDRASAVMAALAWAGVWTLWPSPGAGPRAARPADPPRYAIVNLSGEAVEPGDPDVFGPPSPFGFGPQTVEWSSPLPLKAAPPPAPAVLRPRAPLVLGEASAGHPPARAFASPLPRAGLAVAGRAGVIRRVLAEADAALLRRSVPLDSLIEAVRDRTNAVWEVTAAVTINERGRVTDVSIENPSGMADVDRTVEAALLRLSAAPGDGEARGRVTVGCAGL